MGDESKSKAELIQELHKLREQAATFNAYFSEAAPGDDRLFVWLSKLVQLVFEFDRTGKLFDASLYTLQYMGYTLGDVGKGLFLQQLIHPEDWPRVEENFALVLRGGGLFGHECRALRKDGSSFPVMTTSRRIFIDGELLGLCVFAYDISGLKRKEAILQQQQDFYRTLFDTLGTAVVIFGDDSIIRNCNSRFETLCGLPRDAVENKLRWDDFVPESEARRMRIYHSMRREEHCYAPKEYEFAFKTYDGTFKYVHLMVEMVAGTDLRVCVLTDITARVREEEDLRKSSERYELVVGGANDGIWDYDLATKSMYFSPGFRALMGYTEEDLPNTSGVLEKYIHPDDYKKFIDYIYNRVHTDDSHLVKEFRMLHKDGCYRWLLSRGSIIRDDEGNARRLVGIHTDITERKLHERTTNALYAISKAISTTRDLQHLYEDIHSILGLYIDAANFFISLLDEENDCLFFPYFMDEHDSSYNLRDVSTIKTKSLTVHVIRTGKPLFFTMGDSVWQMVMEDIGVVGTAPAVWLGVPLKLKGRIVGAMAVQHYSNPRHYTEADVAFMEAVSEQVALAIER